MQLHVTHHVAVTMGEENDKLNPDPDRHLINKLIAENQ
jgi:hypothetical protein